MAAPKRRFFVPVLPAVGLAAVAAGPVLQALGSAPGGSMVANLASAHGGGGQARPTTKHGDDGRHGRPVRRPIHGHLPDPWKWKPPVKPGARPTTTTADPPAGGTPTTTAAPTTTTAKATTTTVKATTTTLATTTTVKATTTTVPAASPITVSENYTQLVNGSPMLLQLTVDNTSAAVQTVTMNVTITGTLARYLNVNSDSAQVELGNWKCATTADPTSAEFNASGGPGPYEFTCTATIPANTSNTAMVTTGSKLPTTTKGGSVTIATQVTGDTPAGTPYPALVSDTQTIA